VKSEREVISDVFIFDPNEEVEIYNLVILIGAKENSQTTKEAKDSSVSHQSLKNEI
jgi:hypothetical protein